MRGFSFEVKELERQDIFVCHMRGAIDITSSMELEYLEQRLICKGNERLIFDFSDLDYINSQGLGALLSMHRTLDSGGGGIILVSLPENLRKIFYITGFDQVVPIYPTINAALAKDVLFKTG